METPAEWLTSTVNLETNSTTVYAGPCLLRGASVAVATSAQVCLIKDNTTIVTAVPASAPVGTWVEFGDGRIESSLVVDPDDSATGYITVIYKPFHDGGAGSGY